MLKCRSCGVDLHARDVDFDTLRASCRACGWQVGGPSTAYRQGAVKEAAPTSASVAPAPSTPLPWLPPYVTVDDLPGGELAIVIRESRLWRFYLAMILFALLAWLQYRMHEPAGGDLLFGVLVLACMVWAVGVIGANTRTVVVERNVLRVSHAPFPWFGRVVPVGDLEQLWVDEQSHRDDITYRLRARVRGKDVTLVRFIPDASAALHLERRIEQRLGIVDRPVAGEISAR